MLLNQLTRFMISELISESKTGKILINQRIYNLLSIHLITNYVCLSVEKTVIKLSTLTKKADDSQFVTDIFA